MNKRRKIIKGTGVLLGASILEWHKPIVKSIVLPAHAQTSNEFPSQVFVGGGSCFEFQLEGSVGSINVKLQVSDDFFVEGDVEVLLNDFELPIQVLFSRDCNGVSTGEFPNFVLIDNFSVDQVEFRVVEGRIGNTSFAFPGVCTINELSCT